MAAQGFFERLIGSRFVWVLVDEDGTFRLATPPNFPGLPGLSTEKLEELVSKIRRELPGWNLIVSVPKSLPGSSALVGALVQRGGRALQESEWKSVGDAGMEIPFGEWASSSWADLYIVEEEAVG